VKNKNVMVRTVNYLYNLTALSWCLTSVVFAFTGTGQQGNYILRFMRD
jgi:hypothetical protein